MLTKIEMQYMDAVIQMNRRQRNNEVDWEQRRFELTKAALATLPMLPYDFKEAPTPETIASRAIAIADAVVAELMTTEDPK